MLLVCLGGIFIPSKDYLSTIFVKYRTVLASFGKSNAAVQRQPTLLFQMSSFSVSKSQALKTQTHLEP